MGSLFMQQRHYLKYPSPILLSSKLGRRGVSSYKLCSYIHIFVMEQAAHTFKRIVWAVRTRFLHQLLNVVYLESVLGSVASLFPLYTVA